MQLSEKNATGSELQQLNEMSESLIYESYMASRCPPAMKLLGFEVPYKP